MIAGLTGGIGSGKSVVAKLFELLGCAVFDSDVAAKDIYFNSQIKLRVTELLGKEAYLSNTKINKAYIGSKIFSDTQTLQQLNAIIHPAVIDTFKDFVKKNPNKLIIKETALLFEAHLEKEVDKIIVVAADDELRVNRVMERDGLNKEDILKKIKTQLAQEEKIKKADFVIYNDEQRLLLPQVLAIYNTLINLV